jgi:hypothetical protein
LFLCYNVLQMADTITFRIKKLLRSKFETETRKRTKTEIINDALELYLTGDPMSDKILQELQSQKITLQEIRDAIARNKK